MPVEYAPGSIKEAGKEKSTDHGRTALWVLEHDEHPAVYVRSCEPGKFSKILEAIPTIGNTEKDAQLQR